MRDDPNVDAVSVSTYYAGTVADWGIEAVTQSLRDEGKIVFSWIIGMMDATRKAQMHLQGHGVPVYRELNRAVESVSAVFSRARTLKRAQSKEDFTVPPLEAASLDLIHQIKDVGDEYISKKVCRPQVSQW